MIFKNDAIKYGKTPNSYLNLVLTISANFINKKIRNLILKFILGGASVQL